MDNSVEVEGGGGTRRLKGNKNSIKILIKIF